MSVVVITKENFDTEVMQAAQPVIIDFWATWCGPCQMMGPVVEELADEIPDVKFCKVNVDEQPELAAKFGVMSIPTFIMIKDGKEVKKTMGAMPKSELAGYFGI